MSYSTITGMRSARYPLQGGYGCGCSGTGGCGCSGVGRGPGVGGGGEAEGPNPIIGIAAVGLMGIGLLWFMGREALKPKTGA
jgi:hypothetical protein